MTNRLKSYADQLGIDWNDPGKAREFGRIVGRIVGECLAKGIEIGAEIAIDAENLPLNEIVIQGNAKAIDFMMDDV